MAEKIQNQEESFNEIFEKLDELSKDEVTYPICIVVLGMAGSGKTTFVQKLSQVSFENYKPYLINLDPACKETPYGVNIDIRDTVNYKEVMKNYKLGPNGAIVTALNMFTTKYEDVIKAIKIAGQKGQKLCIIDTPGQIEVFTWSASGTIITESLGTFFPTIVVYVMDLVRSVNTTTFMSNMLYACSILYKARLPFIVALNKIDEQDPTFAIDWMTDFTVFQEAMEKERSYVSNLSRTMSLTLDEFYRNLKTCAVSSKFGVGFNKFLSLIEECVTEYKNNFKEEFKQNLEKRLNSQAKLNKENEPGISKQVEEETQANIRAVRIKSPGEESSEDEEGHENVAPAFNEEIQDSIFQEFINSHNESNVKK